MSLAFTDLGTVEYKPTWLEQQLEAYLGSESPLAIPPAKGIDTGSPPSLYLCRYVVGRYSPFDAVIYTKQMSRWGQDEREVFEVEQASETLGTILNTPEYLEEEMARFVLGDGFVALAHHHNFRQECEDAGFSVRWGGGDFSTCPSLVPEGEIMGLEGAALGREACLYALDALLAKGGLYLR